MSRLTGWLQRVTMRKPARAGAVLALLAGLAGCSTPGSPHLYMAGPATSPVVDRDLVAEDHAQLSGFISGDERVVGLAYDFNTDFLWLRLAPGDHLRVVNRPAKRVERSITLPSELFAAPGRVSLDLATRSANRHVFAALAAPGAVAELTLRGEVVREWTPGGEAREIGGLAYDQGEDLLLVLYRSPTEIVAYDRSDRLVYQMIPAVEVVPATLAYDSSRQHYFLPLPELGEIGEFDRAGRLIRRLQGPSETMALDAGARAFLRMF